jgi:hypothetical protein
MNGSKVYVVHNLGRVNLLPAEDFGELVICLDRYYNHVQVRRAYANLREAMRDVTRDDFILPVGNPSYIAFAGGIMMDRTGIIRTLQWDRQLEKYYVQEIEK